MPRPGVNGHGIHRIHGPQPNCQKNFFSPSPPYLFGEGRGTQLPGRGCGGPRFQWHIRGGVEGSRIVPSITCPEIPGRTFRWPFRPDHQHVRSAAQADSLPALLILSDAQQPCETGGAGRPRGNRGDLFTE